MSIKQKKQLSEHVPRKQRALNDQDFGSYLAGLIDGDGHFNNIGQCIIAFNLLDKSHAYEVKRRIGFGSVVKVPEKNAVNLVICGKNGLLRIVNLVSGKLRHPDRIIQLNTRILPYYNFPHEPTQHDQPLDLDSFWFAGFIDSDGYFGLRILTRIGGKYGRTVYETRLTLKIDQKTNILLAKLKEVFGGYMGYRKSQDSHYYESVSFFNFYKVLSYVDKYHLQSARHYLVYRLMRKAYIIVQSNDHFTEKGRLKLKGLIAKIKKTGLIDQED